MNLKIKVMNFLLIQSDNILIKTSLLASSKLDEYLHNSAEFKKTQRYFLKWF